MALLVLDKHPSKSSSVIESLCLWSCRRTDQYPILIEFITHLA